MGKFIGYYFWSGFGDEAALFYGGDKGR